MKPNFELSVVELLGNEFHLVVGMAVSMVIVSDFDLALKLIFSL